MEPQVVADIPCQVGEGPLWHAKEKRVYWSDILGRKLYRYDPATAKSEQVFSGPMVGGFTIQHDGSLLLFMERGAIGVLKGGKLSYLYKEIPEERQKDCRFNDVRADPQGRVFCGTMAINWKEGTWNGRLYRLDNDGKLTKLLDDIGISNGMGYTLDLKQMYYTDSAAHKIYIFDYERESGNISNQRVFVETPANEGIPDGMVVDSQGYVWSARYGASMIVRYTPQGKEERRLHFPTAKNITSLIFAGDDLTDIYVTCAGGQDRKANGQYAGALFRLNVGIKGQPEFLSRISI